MKNTFGNNITVTIFGESHGPAIGAVIDGMPPGIKINSSFIKKQLDKRKPKGKISTARVESDRVQIISGVFEGFRIRTSTQKITVKQKRSLVHLTQITAGTASISDFRITVEADIFPEDLLLPLWQSEQSALICSQAKESMLLLI